MNFNLQLNDKQWQLMVQRLKQGMSPGPLLQIAGQVMRSSIEQTFRGQGSPAGSWKPLAASTLKRLKGRGGKMLIRSGRLKNSVTYSVNGNVLTVGTNLVYARIQQQGGEAGRRGPFKKQDGRRARIPARPYLVFRPEDPQKIASAIGRYVTASAEGGSFANPA